MNSWQWEDVWTDDVSVDAGPEVFYFVLYVCEDHIETEDSVWDKIKMLTRQSLLGCRAALSPDKMTVGDFADHYTIILDVPTHFKSSVEENLQAHDLWKYVRQWKSRPRFTKKESGSEGFSEIIEEYPCYDD